MKSTMLWIEEIWDTNEPILQVAGTLLWLVGIFACITPIIEILYIIRYYRRNNL